MFSAGAPCCLNWTLIHHKGMIWSEWKVWWVNGVPGPNGSDRDDYRVARCGLHAWQHATRHSGYLARGGQCRGDGGDGSGGREWGFPTTYSHLKEKRNIIILNPGRSGVQGSRGEEALRVLRLRNVRTEEFSITVQKPISVMGKQTKLKTCIRLEMSLTWHHCE